MATEHKNRPQEETVRGAGRRTTNRTPSLTRFVPAHPWAAIEVETALATAKAPALVAALDQSGSRNPACHCPACGSLRTVRALGPWHWQCDRCHQLGSWLALRQSVAMSVESCVRLAEAVHGVRAVAA